MGDDIATWLLTSAGMPGEAYPGPVALAEALGLTVVRGDRHGPGDARLEGDKIVVRRRLEGERLSWAVAHELAEWALVRLDYRGEDRERVADDGAASLLGVTASCR